jgi:two-component system, NarL family, nitrate/nitrite response regulator NarL
MTDPRIPLLRVHIAAGYPAVRAGLVALLGLEAGIDAAPIPDADETMDQTCPVSPLPTVIVADVGSLADSALEEVLYRNPSAPILLLGAHPGSDGPGLRRGPAGYLPPDADGPTLAAAARALAMGLSVVDPSLFGVADLPVAGPLPAEGEALTPREREVLELVAVGLPNKAIARELGISEHTAKFHVGSLLGKLGASSRTEAVTIATRRGLLTI